MRGHKIDLMKLAANGSTEKWNAFLTRCLRRSDLHSLETVLCGIQLGMKDLADKRLNTDKMSVLFIRLQSSIEKTIKRIIRAKEPNPLDNPLNKKKWMSRYDDKKARDQAIAAYIRRISY